MAFYSPDASMDQRLTALVQSLAQEHGSAAAGDLSITWLRYPRSLLAKRGLTAAEPAPSQHAAFPQDDSPHPATGASWQGGQLRDPGRLVHLPYLIAVERWLRRELLEEEPELRRALATMVRSGSALAASHVVDRLSGTTSGPVLPPHHRNAWCQQRRLVTGWLASLGWPELEDANACQKTWGEVPYGRELEFLGPSRENANRLSSEGLARMLEAVMAGDLISPPACQRMRALLAMHREGNDPDTPATTTLEGLMPATGGIWRLWGLADRRTPSAHLAIYGEADGQDPFLLTVLAEGGANAANPDLLTRIVSELSGSALPARDLASADRD